MKNKNRILKLFSAVLLIALFVVAIVLPSSALRYDYSSSNATSKITLTTDELVDIFLDDSFALTQEERAYLTEYGSDTLTYGTRVPSSYISSEFDENSATLTIKAGEYSYKSTSGDITWVPTRVTFMGENVDFSLVDGEYVAEIQGASPGEEDNAEVLYKASISFSEGFVNSLINKAYNDGEAWSNYKKYVGELAEYKENLALYEQYLIDKKIYNDKYKEYKAYLEEKSEYEKEYERFLQYEEELRIYNEKYAVYIQYLNDLKVYNDNLSLYNKYVENIKIAEEQILTLVNTNKSLPTKGRPLYGAIMGPTVTKVVENKDAIANELTGVDGAVVDMAGEATEKLRSILPAFHEFKNDADRYLYYSLNYERIRDNFNSLFKSLDFLYKNGKVRLALGEMDMKDKYELFLAQLYYVVLALNDTPVYDYEGKTVYNSSYLINGKTPISLCEGEAYTPDVSTAVPLSHGYPQKVEEPVCPGEVKEPTRPNSVTCPTEPKAVEDPGDPPKEVTRPTAPLVVNVPDKSILNSNGEIPDGILALILAYENGRLIKRDEYNSSLQIELFAYASKKLVNVENITVKFYDEPGGNLLETVVTERGSYVEYTKQLPIKTEEGKVYTFVGWADENGNLVDMTSVNPNGSEISLYPQYSWEYKSFNIGWDIFGEISYEKYTYGTMPEYKGQAPRKGDEGSYMFVFAGWNEKFSPATSDRIYTAQFIKRPIVSDANGNAGIVTYDPDEALYTVDCTSSLSKEFDLEALLTRAKDARAGVKLIMRTGTVMLPFSEVVRACDNAAYSIKLVSLKRGSGENTSYVFSLTMATKAGVTDMSIRATLTLPYSIADTDRTQICYENDGVEESVRYTSTSDDITISISSGVQYYSVIKYSVTIMNDEMVELVASADWAESTERVKISYQLPLGYRLSSLYYIDANGDRFNITADIFDMPSSDIVIGIDYEPITYKVEFISDGKVISSLIYSYGETPTAPGTPNKADDGQYTYKFVGWDKEITAVDSSITYTALYERIEIEVDEDQREENELLDNITGGLKITPGVMKIILVIAYFLAAMPLVILAVIRVIILFSHRVKKREKRK